MEPPPPPLGFLICCNISKQFCLHLKAHDLLYKMRYILWVMALFEVCDVTKLIVAIVAAILDFFKS